MRVVLDTNVLIAAFIARGACSDVFERVVNEHELTLSPFVLEEFERVMTRKLGLDGDRVARAVTLLRRKGIVVEPALLDAPVCRDPDDDQILALAREDGVRFLVTGDDDLLILGVFDGVPIISPRQFLTHPDS
jgi:putative PIN family toxin of toxin-antitoxin system